MKKYIIIAVHKTILGESISAFGSGIMLYTGYPATYEKIKKYDRRETAERRARTLKHQRKEYFIFVEDVDINEPQEKDYCRARTVQRAFAF